MIRLAQDKSVDPRSILDGDALEAANARASSPVAMGGGFSPGLAMGFVAVLALGGFTFASLSARRDGPRGHLPLATPSAPLPQQQPIRLPPLPLAATRQLPLALPSVAPGTKPAPVEQDRSPAIVVDLTKGTTAAGAALAKNDPATPGESAEEKFADRLAREEAKPARAIRIGNGAGLVAQGTVMTGVLETAINSDLPGFVRAVISRDVSSFDGSAILIPAGSRLIGQYRSGLAAGQTRAFVIWTRLVRPDGVSVALASPVTDQLGRAGLGGKVDSHFFQRFGSAVLLSVVQAGLGSLGGQSNGVVVRTAEDARSVAGIALQRDIAIPPTVKVPQGTPIRVFIARDLDFSGIETP